MIRNKNLSPGFFCALAVVGLLSSLVQGALAKDVTLAWSPNQESDISGYNLYYGEQGKAASKLTVAVNSGSVTGLVEGKTYFFYATAFNSAGLESDPSETITYTVPISSQKQMDYPVAIAGSGMQITSRGTIGQSYAIQATSDLGNGQWITLQVTQPDQNGLITLIDPATDQDRRFYRTIRVP
jgi:hypothetical protein